jgi:3-methylcrotonyl-CoA carboxylase alpha subunit
VKPIRLTHRGATREIRVEGPSAVLDGRTVRVETPEASGAVRSIIVDGRPHRVAAARAGDLIRVWCDGRTYEFETVRPGRAAAAGDHHHGGLLSPMPGRVRRVLVAEGTAVERGQALLVLEAMKMEHSIRAPRDGVVRKIAVAEGDLVDAGVALVELG